jgi:hypothetical protein
VPGRFGQKKLFLTTFGHGPVTAVKINERNWRQFDAVSVFLPYDKTPAVAHIQILLDNTKPHPGRASVPASPISPAPLEPKAPGPELAALDQRVEPLREFHRRLAAAGLGETPEADHVQLALDCIETAHRRQRALVLGEIKPLPGPAEAAAHKSYLETAQKLCTGLDAVLKSSETATAATPRKIYAIWREVAH